MSEAQVEVARRLVECFNSGDPEPAQAFMAEDVELVPLRAAIEDTAYRGPGAFETLMAENEKTWERIRFEPEEYRSGDDTVVAIGRLVARARVTGADVEMRVAMLMEFDGERLSSGRTYTEVGDALDAAGLSG